MLIKMHDVRLGLNKGEVFQALAHCLQFLRRIAVARQFLPALLALEAAARAASAASFFGRRICPGRSMGKILADSGEQSEAGHGEPHGKLRGGPAEINAPGSIGTGYTASNNFLTGVVHSMSLLTELKFAS